MSLTLKIKTNGRFVFAVRKLKPIYGITYYAGYAFFMGGTIVRTVCGASEAQAFDFLQYEQYHPEHFRQRKPIHSIRAMDYRRIK